MNPTKLNNRALLQELLSDFNRQMISDPNFLPGIPNNAHIVIQVNSDRLPPDMKDAIRSFNRWSKALGERQKESDQKLYIATCYLVPPLVRATPSFTVDTIAEAKHTYTLQPA